MAREFAVEDRETAEVVEAKDELEVFKLATRWAVAGGIADTCIGGRLTGFAFLGSVDDIVFNVLLRTNSIHLRFTTYLPAFSPHEN